VCRASHLLPDPGFTSLYRFTLDPICYSTIEMSLPSSRSDQPGSQPGLTKPNPSAHPARDPSAAQQRLPTQLEAGNRAPGHVSTPAAVPNNGGGTLADVPGDGASPPKSSAKGGAAAVQAAGITAPATQAVFCGRLFPCSTNAITSKIADIQVLLGPPRGAHPAPMQGDAKDQALRPRATLLSTIHRGGNFILRVETHILIEPLGPSQRTPASLVSEVAAAYNKMPHKMPHKNAKIPNMSATSAGSGNSWVLQHVPNSSKSRLH